MSNEIIATDLRGQEVDNLITLFILELPNGTKLHFHPGLDGNLAEITFRDDYASYTERTYVALPLDITDIEVSGDGASNRPTLSVANVLTTFRDLLPDFEYDKLLGSRLTRRTTLQKYLTSGSGSVAPTEFPKISYIIDRIKSETPSFVTFELASPFDLEGISIPKRIVVGKYCSWIYKQGTNKGSGCVWKSTQKFGTDYNHTTFYKANNTAIISKTSLSAAATTWVAGTTYSSDMVVKHSSEFYQSNTDGNRGITPGTNEGGFTPWVQREAWVTWSSAGINYAVGDYVTVYGNPPVDGVFECKIAHTSSNDNAPNTALGSSLWAQADVCGKTLESCNLRFNSNYNFATGTNGIPSLDLLNNVVLPFGAFPGAAKFR